MAIFGKLSDFPLAEVLSVIGKRAGQLTLEEADGRRLRLRLQNEQLLGLSLEQPIGEPGEIKRALQSIGDASFHFEPTPPMEAKPGQHLPIDQVLASLAPSSRAEPSVHPDTRFVLIRGRTVTLPAELDAFLARAMPLLAEGCSARQLAKALKLEVRETCASLQHLREIKKIWPVRAHESAGASTKHANPTLASRLKRLFRP